MIDLLRQHLLTLIIFLPAAGAGAVALVRPVGMMRRVALIVSLATLVLSLLLLIPAFFDWTRIGPYAPLEAGGVIQLVRRLPLVAAIRAEYFVGLDGLSLPLVILSGVTFSMAILASWRIEHRPHAFFALLLLLKTGLLGVFLSLDLLLVFVFLQLALLSTCFLIAGWGGPNKRGAGVKFFLHTFVGSIAFLVAVTVLALRVDSFDLIELPSLLQQSALDVPVWANAVFALVLVGFLTLLAVAPLHLWLPDALVEAPTPLSMVLSAVLLKVGGYGLLRIAMPLFPAQLEQASSWLAAIGVASILYGALCAMGQTDFKRLVAYSSISQMGFVLLGLSLATTAGVGGALFLMVAHGLTSAALLFVVGIIEERVGHRDLGRLGGFARTTPNFARVSSIFVFASLGLPGLCNFVGEILVLIGTFTAAPVARWPIAIYVLAVLATFSITLTACYMLRAFQRGFLGIPLRDAASARDLDQTESLVLWTLAALVIALGVMPWPLMLMFSDASVSALVRAIVG